MTRIRDTKRIDALICIAVEELVRHNAVMPGNDISTSTDMKFSKCKPWVDNVDIMQDVYIMHQNVNIKHQDVYNNQ